ncbi:3-phosphoshikimate 1-carboxyvinyltransferase [Thermosynechococcaceae cyanobacterium BACA0444]|uniref:3-phosphoshikimate 1-carboxyvinyltransferase n=1 Tax=Pseudocalidococcus azoricus BACA0444 TaxID=2918990 RepID=A0AAE4FS87_9CYAN|nr:3-phosphoshikimate 1-carboxyvinyltransferase [Pseudocalidococcus azoricus]MDS3861378.1 3-phosphoshikimate 1-carboxyvinyltransferase [Pseudocalidococcus azoricus BACA0444]
MTTALTLLAPDTWQIRPGDYALQGTVMIPGDKSISHRALMLGALAAGQTEIRGLLLGDDPRSTAACFQALGATISELNSDCVVIQGIGNLQEAADVLDAGNSGTTLRLMLGILASQPGKFYAVTGDSSLRGRPMKRVVQPLQSMGATIWGRGQGNFAPLAVQGQTLQAIHYHSPIASAQVKSCLLLAGLHTPGITTITEPALSRDHSERMLKAFGATLEVDPELCQVSITGPGQLQGQQVTVPGDISSAAFWLVAAAITPGSELFLPNVGVNPTRTGVLEVLEAMGANITQENMRIVTGEPVADLRVSSSPLQATVIEGKILPRLIDEVPILAVAAAFAQGTTVIRDAAELRVKESDRLQAIATQLGRMGVKVTELPDGLEIIGGEVLQGAEVDSWGDHRMAMSLAIAGLQAKGTTTIQRGAAATVSYPNFTESLEAVLQSP